MSGKAISLVMSATTTHLFVTHEGPYGYSLDSPQLPGFTFSRPTLTEFNQDYQQVVRSLGVKDPVLIHRQQRYTTDDGREYVLRCAQDQHADERLVAIQRVEGILATGQAEDFLDRDRNAMGEVVYAAVLPGDPLRFVLEQLRRHDAIAIAVAVADGGLFTTSFVSGYHPGPSWRDLNEYGWTLDTPISQLMQESEFGERRERVLVAS